MILSGRVVEVSAVTLGDVLTADHAAGATVLAVNSTVDFEGAPQVALTDDLDVTYLLPVVEVDDEAETVTVASGLPVAFGAESFVAVYPPSDEKEAQVVVEDGDDSLTARVPHGLYDRMPEGVREPGAEEAVEVSDDGGEWVISDVLGLIPLVDGTFIDPDSLPVPPPPEPLPPEPPVAPTFNVTGMPRGLMVQVTNGQPGWSYTYTITDTNDDATADVTASFPATSRPIFYTETMPDGTPLSAESQGYSWTITATNESGSATSAASDAQGLVLNDDNTIAELAVGKLKAGDLIGAFALLGALNVGDNIEITPEAGIVVHTPLGDTVLPANGQNPQFTGSATFDALTILGNLGIRGLTNEVTKGSRLELATGTTAPKSSPTVTPFWTTKPIHDGYSPRGMARHAATGRFYHTESLFGASVSACTEDADSFDFVFGGQVQVTGADNGAGGWNRGEVTSALGGVAIIGNTMYVLCQTDELVPGTTTYQARWYVYRGSYDSGTGKWSYVGRWLYEPTSFLGGNSDYRPCIGVKESTSELFIAQCGSGGGAWGMVFTPGSGALQSRTAIKNSDGSTWDAARDFVSANVTAGDFGGDRLVVMRLNDSLVRVFDGTYTHLANVDFSSPSSSPIGAMWDGNISRFRTRAATSAYEHSAITATTFAVVQTWRKADGTSPDFAQYETDKSPAAITTTFPRRASMQVTSTPIPDDSTDPNDPDSLTFYVATNDLSGANAGFKRQAPPAVGVTTQRLSVISTTGGAPPVAANFPAATPASLTSDAADTTGELIRLLGSGAWRLGDISGDSAGRVVGGAFVPIGGLVPFLGSVAPTGFLKCDGSTFSSATYPLLAAVLGSTTLPNMTGRVARGATPGSTGGSDTVTMPDHNHYAGTYGTGGPTGGVTRGTGAADTAGASHTHTVNGQSGVVVSNPAISNVPSYVGVTWLVRAA